MRTSIRITALAFALSVVGCIPKVEKKETVVTTEPVVVATSLESTHVEQERRSVVFITGYDKGGKTFYADAKTYFETQNNEIVETAYSLQEIILWLNINHYDKPFTDIHIVNANKWNELSLETTVKGDNITTQTLKKSIDDGVLPKLNNVLSQNAKLIFHASSVGSNAELLNTFKQIFTTDVAPSIVASPMISVFGGEYTQHYMAKPYYAFYPTAHSPGRVDLSKEFENAYPNAGIDWLSVMNIHEERYQGDIYSYKFNIPVKFEIEFNGDDEIPSFRSLDEMFAWMKDNDEIAAELNEIGIPIEKFRWFEKIEDDKLIIKGKVSVICVLEPVMSNAYPSEYMIPNIDNLRLYNSI